MALTGKKGSAYMAIQFARANVTRIRGVVEVLISDEPVVVLGVVKNTIVQSRVLLRDAASIGTGLDPLIEPIVSADCFTAQFMDGLTAQGSVDSADFSVFWRRSPKL